MTLNDFNRGAEVNMARLCNFLMLKLLAISEPENQFSSAAVARVARYVSAHQQSFPVRPGTCRWPTVDALTTCVRNLGPSCSADDILAAVTALPDAANYATAYMPKEPNYEG